MFNGCERGFYKMFLEIDDQIINLDNIIRIYKKYQYSIVADVAPDEFIEIYTSKNKDKRDAAYDKIKLALSQCHVVKEVVL